MRQKRATVKQALTVTCPECEAKPGKPCVYLPLTNYGDDVVPRSWAIRERIQKTGTPTTRPHNGRFGEAFDRVRSRAAYARKREDAKKIARSAPSPRLRAVVRAQQAWDRGEWTRLGVWLRTWGHILK